VNGHRFRKAADAPGLDVDHAAAFQFQRRPRVGQGVDAFVEAEGRLELALQFGMVIDVLVAQGLLDQQQTGVVHRPENADIAQFIGGIGVHLEEDLGKLPTEGLHQFDVASGGDLDLDPPVSFVQIRSDFFDERCRGRLKADADADGHPVAPAAQHLGERDTLRLGQRVPKGRFQSGFGHTVAPEPRPEGDGLIDPGDLLSQDGRDQAVAKDVPGGLDRLGRIERRFFDDALSPARQAAAVEPDQDVFLVGLDAHGRLEGGHQFHFRVSDLDPVDTHGFLLFRSA